MTNEEKIREWAKRNGEDEQHIEIATSLLESFTRYLEDADGKLEDKQKLGSLASYFFAVDPDSPFAMAFVFFSAGYAQGMKDWDVIVRNERENTDKKE